MSSISIISLISSITVIIALVLEYIAFFTGYWLKVYSAPEVKDNLELISQDGNVNVLSELILKNHGLWDNGITDLNCPVTPFGICMYTRACLFAGIILISVALVFSIISTAIITSEGNIATGGTMARSSAILLTLSDIGFFIGLVIFTVQHTSCISSCEEEQMYYPKYPNDLQFDWSFILAWVGLFFVIVTTVLQYLASCLAQAHHKSVYSPSTTMKTATVDRDIELVRVNEPAVAGYNPRKV